MVGCPSSCVPEEAKGARLGELPQIRDSQQVAVVGVVENLLCFLARDPLDLVDLLVLLEPWTVGERSHGVPVDFLFTTLDPMSRGSQRGDDPAVVARLFEDFPHGSLLGRFPLVGLPLWE